MEPDNFIRTFVASIKKNSKKDFVMFSSFIEPCQVIALYNCQSRELLTITRHDPKETTDNLSVFELKDELEMITFIDSKILADPYWSKKNLTIQFAGFLNKSITHHPAAMKKTPSFLSAFLSKDKDSGCDYSIFKFLVNPEIDDLSNLMERGPNYVFSDSSKEDGLASSEEIKIKEKKTHLFGSIWYPPFIFIDQVISLKPKCVLSFKYDNYDIFFDNQSYVFLSRLLRNLVTLSPRRRFVV